MSSSSDQKRQRCVGQQDALSNTDRSIAARYLVEPSTTTTLPFSSTAPLSDTALVFPLQLQASLRSSQLEPLVLETHRVCRRSGGSYKSEYERVSDADMDTLHENLEILCEEHGLEGWEVEYSAGVLTLHLPPAGTWVINKQPPNQQIWMSSPLSGPSRFGYGDMHDGPAWVHHRREGVTLGGLLEGEVRGLLGGEGEGAGWEGTGLR